MWIGSGIGFGIMVWYRLWTLECPEYGMPSAYSRIVDTAHDGTLTMTLTQQLRQLHNPSP